MRSSEDIVGDQLSDAGGYDVLRYVGDGSMVIDSMKQFEDIEEIIVEKAGIRGTESNNTFDLNEMEFSLGDRMVDAGSGDDRIIGTEQSERMYVEKGQDQIISGGGQDLMYGGGGADEIIGSEGVDFIDGGAGADRLLGGGGDDYYQVSSATDFEFDSVEDNGGRRDLLVYSGNGALVINEFTESTGIDRILSEQRKILGNDNDNVLDFSRVRFQRRLTEIDGGAGNDVISGSRKSDILIGGEGNDILRASRGNDQIDGGLGDDRLEGGAGRDRIRGGLGNDMFLVRLQDGKDIIEDFTTEADQILLDRAFFAGDTNLELNTFRLKDYLVEMQMIANVSNGVLLKFNDQDQVTLEGAQLDRLENHHFDLID